MKRACELCEGMARMHCESDQASLCWDCDAKVHSANFLVARHSRILLCHMCQSLTPWSASGAKLGPTVSFCEQCVDGGRCDESGDEDEEEATEVEEVDEEEVGENQVVPWSPPPPVSESSSDSEESVGGGEVVVSRKRCRLDNASSNHPSNDNQGYSSSSSELNIHTAPSDSAEGAVAIADSMLPRRMTIPLQKFRRMESRKFQRSERVGVHESVVLESLRRFDAEETGSGSSAQMAESCTLSKCPRAGRLI